MTRTPKKAARHKSPAATSLRTELARQIVEIARDEAWSPGMHVPELALARRFGVSRSPVRGALQLLAQRSVLRLHPGEGFILTREVADAADSSLVPHSDGENLYARIVKDRATGKLANQVSEAELSGRYGATRGAVRRVLMRLAAEGLAERLRGHGWGFTETLDTETAVTESYRFRIAVECAGLRQPGYAIDELSMTRLRRAHERVLSLPAGSMDQSEWFRVNAGFHEALAEWSGNRFILQAVRQQNRLRQLIEYEYFPSLTPEQIFRSCKEHLDILDALETGDRLFAESLLNRHLRRAGQVE